MAAERVERQGEYHGRGRATKSGITPRVSLLPAERVARQVDLQWKRETFSSVIPVVFGFSLNLRMAIPGRGVATTTPTWDAAWISPKQTLQSFDF